MAESDPSVALLQAQRDLALVLASAQTMDDVLQPSVDAAMAIATADAGAMYLLDPASGALELRCYQGVSEAFAEKARWITTDEQVRRLFTSREPCVLGLPNEAREAASCVAEGLRFIAAFAILHEGKVFGSIHVASRSRDGFEPRVIQGLGAIAAQIGGAVARLEAESAARRRARYAESIATAARSLVEIHNPRQALQRVLEVLREATGVSRVYLFENRDDPELGLCMHQFAETVAPGIVPQIDNPLLQRLPYSTGAPHMYERLQAGEVFSGLVRQLPSPEREALEEQGIRSIAAVPVQLRQTPWGFIGLDDCAAETTWTEDDIRVLRTVASMVGSFVERWRAEDAVRESEARYRAIVEGFEGLIYICSSDYRVEFMNSRVASRAGSLGIGDPCHRVLHHQEERCPWCVNDRVYRGETVRFEVKSPMDGRWYYCVNTPIHHTDGTVSKQALILDITERKLAEEAREKFAAKLAESQRLESLGVMAGGIAHDFNNLLVAILGNAELAMLGLGTSSPVRGQLENIRTAAQRAAELTSQMLACAGKGRFVVEKLSLNGIVKEMTELLRVSVPRTATLDIELDPAVPLLEGDSAQIRQVVMNLLKNACDALNGKHGSIELRTGTVEAPAALAEGVGRHGGIAVYLEVTDNGCGMDEATRSRIFEPFFTTKFTGRGLGLAAVQGIVRSHGGNIDVQSTPSQGSRFRVTFPAPHVPDA